MFDSECMDNMHNLYYTVTVAISHTPPVPICCESSRTCKNAHGCLSSNNRPSCCCNYGYDLNERNECVGKFTQ